MLASRSKRLLLALGALLAATTASTAAANINCWTNRDGIFECADRLPPEYAQQRSDVRNRQGLVIETREPAKSREQIEREASEAGARADEKRRQDAQAAHDRMLLSTYIDEQDLARAAERNLLSAESIIALLQRNVDALVAQREALEKVKAKGSGKGAATVDEDVARVTRQLTLAEGQLEARSAERDTMAARFEADLQRFRELQQSRARGASDARR